MPVAGGSVQLMAREGIYAQFVCVSGEVRKVHVDCRATIGEVGNGEHSCASSAGRCQSLAWYSSDGARHLR